MMVPLSPTINAFSPLSSPASQFLAKEKPPLVSPHLRSSCLRSWSNEQGDTLPMALTGGSPLQDVVIGARPDTSSLSPLCLLPTLWTPTASLRGSTFHSKDFLVGSRKSLKVYSYFTLHLSERCCKSFDRRGHTNQFLSATQTKQF